MHRYRTILATLGDNFLTNLVAYWAFENNVNDALGVHNGTTVGSPTYTTGVNGQSINFGNDNIIRYLSVADSNDFSFTDGVTDLSFSISCWVNFSSFTTTVNPIIMKRNASFSEWQLIYLPATFGTIPANRIGIYLFSENSSNVIVSASNSQPLLNNWINVIATYSGNSNVFGLKLYINGILQNTKNTTGTYLKMPNTISPIYMGQFGTNLTSATFKHKGLLDEVAIWKNRELTASEVTKLYNAGAGKFYPF